MTNLIVEKKERVAWIRLNRPQKLNALSAAVFAELHSALMAAEADDGAGAIVLTGSGRAFAAGVDIAEMQAVENYAAAAASDFAAKMANSIPRCRKPLIAAVNGLALGGGCELALMCDFIFAAASAQFAQPEIKLGTIPGLGGTQRLARAVGRARAMEMCLTGRAINAQEAAAAGLAARVIPDQQLEEETQRTAALIASYSQPAVRLLKQAIAAADDMPLSAGLRFERQLFYTTFALQDRTEGMTAFVEKRPPAFQHK